MLDTHPIAMVCYMGLDWWVGGWDRGKDLSPSKGDANCIWPLNA